MGTYEGYMDSVTPGSADERSRVVVTFMECGAAFLATSRQTQPASPTLAAVTAHGRWMVHCDHVYANFVFAGQHAVGNAAGEMRKMELKFEMASGHLANIGSASAAAAGCQRIFSFADSSDAALTPAASESALTVFLHYQHTVQCAEPNCASYP